MPPPKKSVYIVIEGIDGTGKSTLTAGICAALARAGVEVRTCEEPTKGESGLRIRRLLGEAGRSRPVEEWLELFEADRRENMQRNVRPALASGAWVVQDRSFYSTAAYQGAQGADAEAILARNRAFAVEPDLVVILDLDPAVALARITHKRRMETDAFEKADYLARVRQRFQAMQGPNIMHIDASRPVEQTIERVLGEMQRRFGVALK